MAWITGVGLTDFGRRAGVSALEWQAEAAHRALSDGSVHRGAVDGLIVGYATTLSHLMPANLLAEYVGLKPSTAFGMNVGGATGMAMLAHAAHLVDSDEASCVLIAGGEDRASGQTTDTSMSTLAQVGHRDYEVPIGANVPGYYALLASAYLHRHGLSSASLASLAVQMRAHAARHEGAQFRTPIDVHDVVSSPQIASPLRLLDCCPVSDGGAAVVVTAEPTSDRSVLIAGLGQAHLHQHLSEADLDGFGAATSAGRALARASIEVTDVDVLGIYDSFTITVALLLEELGFAEPGRAGALAAEGHFDRDGALPLNTHGGLLSYGHSGVAGGMAHLVEVVTQLRGEGGCRQAARRLTWGLVHADGGVMSAHVTAVLRARTVSSTEASDDRRPERRPR